MYVLKVFRAFQKLLTSVLYTIITFLFASLKLLNKFENANWNPPQSSLLCDWSMFSSADLSLALGKMRKNELVIDGFRSDFSESQSASCKHFSFKIAASSSTKKQMVKNKQRMYRACLFSII